MIIDRNEAQLQAIKTVYPNTIIVFCHIHIRKNFVTHFGSESYNLHLFDEMHYNLEKCDEFINVLETFINDNPKAEGINSLKALLDSKECWLPTLLLEKDVYIKFYNNRSENFFGSFKQRYGFSLRTATVLIKQLQNNVSLQLSSSISSFQNTTDQYTDIFLFLNNKEVSELEKFALSKIQKEYDSFITGEENDFWTGYLFKLTFSFYASSR